MVAGNGLATSVVQIEKESGPRQARPPSNASTSDVYLSGASPLVPNHTQLLIVRIAHGPDVIRNSGVTRSSWNPPPSSGGTRMK